MRNVEWRYLARALCTRRRFAPPLGRVLRTPRAANTTTRRGLRLLLGLVALVLVLMGGGDDKQPEAPATPPTAGGTVPLKPDPPPLPEKKPPPTSPETEKLPPPPPVAANVTVTIESDPKGAEVHLNGVSMGATPLPLKLKKDSGEQEVLLLFGRHLEIGKVNAELTAR